MAGEGIRMPLGSHGSKKGPDTPPPKAHAEPTHHEPALRAEVGTSISARDLQIAHIEMAATKELGVKREDMMGWWRRKAYVVGNAMFGSTVAGSAAAGASYALAGSALAATLPAWVLGAAVGIPTVMLSRYALGLHKVDRMAKAGRVSDKLKKRTAKFEKKAKKYGMDVSINSIELERQVRELSKRPSFGPLAASIGVGLITGAVSYELHTPGENTFTNTLTGTLRSAWDKVTDANWWSSQVSWLWDKACTVTNPHDVPGIGGGAAGTTHMTGYGGAVMGWNGGEVAEYGADKSIRVPEVVPAASPDIHVAAAAEAAAPGDAPTGGAETVSEGDAEAPEAESEGGVEDSGEDDDVEVADAQPQPTYDERLKALLDRTASSVSTEGAGPYYAAPIEELQTLPLDIPITSSEHPIAQHGIDAVFKGLFAESVMPQNVQEQFIDAVRRTLVDHPDLASQMLNTEANVIKAGDVVFPDSGSVNMRVFGSEEFLRYFEQTVNTHEKRYLLPYLEDFGGTDSAVQLLKSTFNR